MTERTRKMPRLPNEPLGDLDNRPRAHFNIGLGSGPAGHADSHCASPVPTRTAEPCDPALANPTNHFARDEVRSERDEDLVEHNVVKDIKTGRPKAICELPRKGTRFAHETCDALPAEIS